MTMTITREFIDKDIAAYLLNNNYSKQRNVSSMWVSTLAEDMKNGNWDDAAANPIKINTHGELIDGQHRMLAVLESDKSNWFWVARGCGENEFIHTDEGKSRSSAQFCNAKNSNSVCALAKGVIAIEKGNPIKSTINGNYRVPISRHEIVHRSNNDESIINATRSGVRMRHSVGCGSAFTYSLFVYLVGKYIEHNQIEQFVEDFVSCEMPNATATAAKILIAKTAASAKTKTLDKMWLFGTLASAYSHYVKADDVTRISNQTNALNKIVESVGEVIGGDK